MTWLQHTSNSQAVLSLYDGSPDLGRVVLHSLHLERDGPCAELVFDLSTFPSHHSERWPLNSNTCQIALQAVAVETLSLESWGTGITGVLAASAESGRVRLKFTGEAVFQLQCLELRIVRVAGYMKGEA
jgi:hypothetical protein